MKLRREYSFKLFPVWMQEYLLYMCSYIRNYAYVQSFSGVQEKGTGDGVSRNAFKSTSWVSTFMMEVYE